jgi:coproporphyrinogen III oxidase-like Fe-S oxidoreductase
MNGCPNKCIFCGQSTGNLPFSFKQPALICEELEALSEKYSTHYFCFLNTNLNFSKSFMLSLCDEIQRRNLDITWTDSANFKNMDDDIVKRLKTSGLNRILFGLESASPRMQQYIQKNIDIKKAEATLKEAHGNNIWNEVYLICGLPHETDEDINQTKDFIQRNQQHINFMHVNPFRLIYSALMQNQARFGIENVKPIADTSTNSSEYFTYSFDEKDGLRWNQKLQQIDNSFDTINSTIRGIKIMSSMKYSSSHLQLIYSLFSLFSSVDEVQSYYSQIQSIKQREKTMN